MYKIKIVTNTFNFSIFFSLAYKLSFIFIFRVFICLVVKWKTNCSYDVEKEKKNNIVFWVCLGQFVQNHPSISS